MSRRLWRRLDDDVKQIFRPADATMRAACQGKRMALFDFQPTTRLNAHWSVVQRLIRCHFSQTGLLRELRRSIVMPGAHPLMGTRIPLMGI